MPKNAVTIRRKRIPVYSPFQIDLTITVSSKEERDCLEDDFKEMVNMNACKNKAGVVFKALYALQRELNKIDNQH